MNTRIYRKEAVNYGLNDALIIFLNENALSNTIEVYFNPTYELVGDTPNRYFDLSYKDEILLLQVRIKNVSDEVVFERTVIGTVKEFNDRLAGLLFYISINNNKLKELDVNFICKESIEDSSIGINIVVNSD